MSQNFPTIAHLNATNIEEFRAEFRDKPILGEAVCYSIRGVQATRSQVEAALLAANLNTAEARRFCFANAFRRAITKMKTGRIVSCLAETKTVKASPRKNRPAVDGMLSFQFTEEYLTSHGGQAEMAYAKEGVIVMNKVTGELSCESTFLLDMAKREMDIALEERRSRDVTAIVGRLYRKSADVFHIVGGRGVFFVPGPFIEFSDKIDQFLAALCNSRVTRLPVPSGTVHGNIAIRDSVVKNIDDIIDDYDQAVEELTGDTTPVKLRGLSKRIERAKLRIAAYQDLMGDQTERLTRASEELTDKLRARLIEIAIDRDAAEQTEQVDDNSTENADVPETEAVVV